MPNIINAMIVRELTEALADVDGMVIVNLNGLTVAETEALRTSLSAQGVRLTVVRNRLARIALCERGLEPPADMLLGSTAMAWGTTEEALGAAKVVSKSEAAKAGKITFKGGLLDGNLLGPEEALAMAELPSRDELRAMLLGVVSGPARQLVGLIHAPGSSLARVIQAHADQHADPGADAGDGAA